MMSLLAPLFDLLICLARFLVGLLLAGVVGLANLLLKVLMAIVGPLLGLLPTVDLSSFDLSGLSPWLAYLNWAFPLDYILAVSAAIVAFLLVMRLVDIGLRWARVRGE